MNERTIRFPLAEDIPQITAGSLSDNTIFLPYRGVSKLHFTIYREGTDWYIRDEGSTNGTFLNGNKIATSPLQEGDRIRAGFAEIEVQSSSPDTHPLLLSREENAQPSTNTDRLSEGLDRTTDDFVLPGLKCPDGFLMGRSPVMKRLYERIFTLGDSDANILLIGETGTGKEMIARCLHLNGRRFGGPFVVVNCAAIPADLLEAELFGIGERVATDVSQRKGRLTAADGGTLFLDELEAFPFVLQAKVLRALEEKMVVPVGEHRSIPIDFRLIAATNQEPRELMESHRLRSDLYHRLATVELRLPPLRDRKEDLEMLIPGMLRQISAIEKKRISGVSKRLMAFLRGYSYPGNLRELNNILRAMVALAHQGEILDIHLLPEKLIHPTQPGSIRDFVQDMLNREEFQFHQAADEFAREFVQQALQRHNGNIRQAAEHMRMTPFGLRKMMKRLGIKSAKDENEK